MPTRNVVITEHQSELIESLVASGRYQNASEVLREGLRLVEERNAARSAQLEAFHDAVAVGLSDIAAGRYTEVAVEDVDSYIAAIGARAARAADEG